MGIKKLNTFLLKQQYVSVYSDLSQFKKSYCNKYSSPHEWQSKHKSYNDKNYIRICIDTNLYMYKYLYSWGKFKYSFLNQIMMFLTNGIIPVYVFDGSAPIEKTSTIMIRRNKKDKLYEKIQYYQSLDITDEIQTILDNLHRKNISITKNDILSFRYMLDMLHLPHCQAIGESDVLCAELCKTGIVDMCLTEDLDILAFGCPRLIKIIKEKVYFYSLENILENLEVSFDKFVLFCTLLGCDYCRPVKTKDALQILKTIKRKCPLDDVLLCHNIVDSTPYSRAIDIFSNAHQTENITNITMFDVSNLDKSIINDFMVENNFNNWQIKRINSFVELLVADVQKH